MIKYLSVFSGIAGFELGIQQAYEELIYTKSNQGERSAKQTLPLSGNDKSRDKVGGGKSIHERGTNGLVKQKNNLTHEDLQNGESAYS